MTVKGHLLVFTWLRSNTAGTWQKYMVEWHAGFVGMEEFEWYVSGALLSLNTFGPHMVMTIAAQAGFTNPTSCEARRRTTCLTYMLVRGLNAWVATCSAAIQRRHLMVWALFAPKFLFEVCFLAVIDISMMATTWFAA